MKKVLSFVLSFVLLFCVSPLWADQMDDFPVAVHNFEIIIFDGTNEYTIATGHLRVFATVEKDPT